MEDLDDLVRFHGDPEVVRYVPWPVRDRAATEAVLLRKLDQAQLTEPGQWLVLAVEQLATARVIGEVLLKWAEEGQGEIGFAFARDVHGQGYAREAAEAMLAVAFDHLGLRRVTAVTSEGNRESQRLLQRLGFEREARFVEGGLFKGEWDTEVIYALRSPQARTAPPADLAAVMDLVRLFVGAFRSGPRVAERMEELRAAMLPQAVVVRTCGGTPQVMTVDTLITPRQQILSDGTLQDFSEQAGLGHVDVYGDIAAWFGEYSKQGVHAGMPANGRGMKSIQCVRTGEGWRISAVAWDDERDGVEHHSSDRFA